MSVYTTVFSASVPIGGLAMGAVASGFSTSVAIALGGVLSVAIGLGALLWGRRGAFALASASAPAASGLAPSAGTARPR